MKKLYVAAVGLNFIKVLESNIVMERCFSSSPAVPSFFFSAKLFLVLGPAFYKLQDKLAQRESNKCYREGKMPYF